MQDIIICIINSRYLQHLQLLFLLLLFYDVFDSVLCVNVFMNK